ncbi:uncharacterized protein BDW70DRAFT_137017 [Aspergillus foveolatus]|uniref:uncharacterized protein n=1 Tax=Aspergillus foveolatus TaxID=210207 RepID=UPI003CCDBADB
MFGVRPRLSLAAWLYHKFGKKLCCTLLGCRKTVTIRSKPYLIPSMRGGPLSAALPEVRAILAPSWA